MNHYLLRLNTFFEKIKSGIKKMAMLCRGLAFKYLNKLVNRPYLKRIIRYLVDRFPYTKNEIISFLNSAGHASVYSSEEEKYAGLSQTTIRILDDLKQVLK
jgi:hypothetical protein